MAEASTPTGRTARLCSTTRNHVESRGSAPALAAHSESAPACVPTDGGVATAPVHHADLHSASRSSETDHLPTIAVIAAHRADRSSVCAVRERGSSLDAPPDTPHPTLPLIAETTASNPSL